MQDETLHFETRGIVTHAFNSSTREAEAGELRV